MKRILGVVLVLSGLMFAIPCYLHPEEVRSYRGASYHGFQGVLVGAFLACGGIVVIGLDLKKRK